MGLDFRCCLLVFFLLPLISPGQSTTVLSGTYRNLDFDTFVSRIEAQSNYTFRYRPEWTDSLTVTITADGHSFYEILDQTLANTELRFSIGDDNTVFITRGLAIQTELPPGFFDDAPADAAAAAPFDYSQYEQRAEAERALQSKVYYIGSRAAGNGRTATVSGIIRDVNTGEPIIGTAVLIKDPVTGTTTNQAGYFSLTLPKGRHELHFQSIGMKSTTRVIELLSDGRLNVDLEEEITPLKEVVIESDRDVMIRDVQMGIARLDIKTMKQIPLALGETDILKVMLTLPGVQSVGEGTVGINVRGGASNQNLILLNDALVYNPSHLFGFFSTFNPDILKNVELYKSGINAEFGGRLSAVLDVHTREGNTKKFAGSGGISPITGRLSVEGPIIKDKTTFIIGGRSTYSSWLLRQLDDPALKKSKASFFDVTGSTTHRINENNTIMLSGYLSQDEFNLASDTVYGYSDRSAVLKWNHIFNPKLAGDFTATVSDYTFLINSTANPVNAFNMGFNINQTNAKADIRYFPNPRQALLAGVSAIRYDVSPGTLRPDGPESLIAEDVLENEQAIESAVYISDQFEYSQKLSIYAGLRFSLYHYLGPRNVFYYDPNSARRPSNVMDTVSFGTAETIARFHGPEPRLSMRYSVGKNAALKISYNRMRQYIQMLTNTAAMTPTDIWKLSDGYIRPQMSDQISAGFYQYLKGNLIEVSVEAYYKTIEHAVDFKNGARLLMNHQMETAVLDADGKAYGVEFLLKKSSGKINGWISYAYSRTFLKTNAEFTYEAVNRGEYYPAPYDKPHAVNFIGNYKFNRRFNFSLNIIYSTGRPITLPITKFDAEGTSRIYYSDRNQYRIPDYFRSDVSINLEGNHKVRKLAHSSWTFSIYNVTGRKNPFSVYFTSEGGKVTGYKLSVFARPIPTITYNFKF